MDNVGGARGLMYPFLPHILQCKKKGKEPEVEKIRNKKEKESIKKLNSYFEF